MVIENRKARHDYFIEKELECGISLVGNEVKSIKAGMASIKEAYCSIKNGTLIVSGMRVTKWDTANKFDVDELRDRVLLAHKREILNLAQKVKLDGYTLVPLKIYESRGKLKMSIGLCKGKHNYDKRESLKQKQVARDIDRAMKGA